MDYKDYYKLLGVERNSTSDQIKRAYRQLAKKFHPDLNPGDKKAEDKFKEINEAYEVLGDDKKRAKYDQLGESYSQWQQVSGKGNFEDWFSQSPGYQQVDYGNLNEMFGGGFSDFFNTIFGQMGGQATPRRQSGRSVRSSPRAYEQPVTISFQEAYQGAERSLQLDGRLLQVKIPAGANNGTRVRMAGIAPGGGDIYLVIEVTPDPAYERKGDDLYTEAPMDLYTAVLGGQAAVTTPGGNVVLTIPAGTQQGQSFRLAGRGMPKLRSTSKEYGDLYARAMVTLPRSLTPRQRELFEQLRKI